MTIRFSETVGATTASAQTDHFDKVTDEKYEVKAAVPTTEVVIPQNYEHRDTDYVWGDCGAYRGERSAKRAAATCTPN